jgi:hypothetical protein
MKQFPSVFLTFLCPFNALIPSFVIYLFLFNTFYLCLSHPFALFHPHCRWISLVFWRVTAVFVSSVQKVTTFSPRYQFVETAEITNIRFLYTRYMPKMKC